ncbi:MAG TPA: hypothetical protein VGI19_18370 [Candidatus Cybelea sp.]
MGKDVGDECSERVRLAFGFYLYRGAHIPYEAGDIVPRRGAADRFTKENALNETTDLDLSSLAHIDELANSRP